MKIRVWILSIILVLMCPLGANAALVGFNIDWTGANGYTMTGMFTFEDPNVSSGGDTLIDQTALETFMIEGFLNGSSIGSFIANTSQPNFGVGTGAARFFFNFNYNSVSGTGTFPSGDLLPQLWNAAIGGAVSSPDFGFQSVDRGQGLNNGPFINESVVLLPEFPLTATPKPVPTPSAMLLMGTGLFGLVGWRWWNKTT